MLKQPKLIPTKSHGLSQNSNTWLLAYQQRLMPLSILALCLPRILVLDTVTVVICNVLGGYGICSTSPSHPARSTYHLPYQHQCFHIGLKFSMLSYVSTSKIYNFQCLSRFWKFKLNTWAEIWPRLSAEVLHQLSFMYNILNEFCSTWWEQATQHRHGKWTLPF